MEGTPFGRYRLVELLGRGGMGEVWRAYDTETSRIVALKTLSAHLAADAGFGERFRREAHAAAGLTEPHVVPIHHFGEIDGRLYVDMRLIEGRDLESLLRGGPLTPDRAVKIVGQVAAALHAAHRVGLVHRDVKPSNILVADDDFAYLIDFGIARTAGEAGLTSTGATIGTWAYMAPERYSAGPPDPRSDVYSLACVLYQALTGELPYPGRSTEEQVRGHLTIPPPRPSIQRPGLPTQFDAVIATGMAKNPDERYPTTRDLALAAERALMAQGAPSSVVADERATEFVRQPWRGPGGVGPFPGRTYDSGGPTQQAPVIAAQADSPRAQPAAGWAAAPAAGWAAAPAAAPPNAVLPGDRPDPGKSSRPWWKRKAVAISALAGCVVVVVGAVALVTTNRSTDSAVGGEDVTASPPMPDIDTLLLGADHLDAIMATSGLTGPVLTELQPDISTVTPEECRSLAIFASPNDFDGSGYTAVRAQRLEFESVYVSQAVFQYESAQASEDLADSMITAWEKCNGRAVTDTADDGHGAWEYSVQEVTAGEHTVTAIADEPSNQHICQNRVQAASLFLVRVALCSPTNNGQAQIIADNIAAKAAPQ